MVLVAIFKKKVKSWFQDKEYLVLRHGCS